MFCYKVKLFFIEKDVKLMSIYSAIEKKIIQNLCKPFKSQNYNNLILFKYLLVNNKNEGFGNLDVNWLCSSS